MNPETLQADGTTTEAVKSKPATARSSAKKSPAATAGAKAKAKEDAPATAPAAAELEQKSEIATATPSKKVKATKPAKVEAVKDEFKAVEKVKAPKAEPEKSRKEKLVRDSFTMPKLEYEAIGELKKQALALGREVKKSELLRAGLLALRSMPDDALSALLAQVPKIKTGRPKKRG